MEASGGKLSVHNFGRNRLNFARLPCRNLRNFAYRPLEFNHHARLARHNRAPSYLLSPELIESLALSVSLPLALSLCRWLRHLSRHLLSARNWQQLTVGRL